MKAIEAGSLAGLFVPYGFWQLRPLALQYLQTPEGSTDRTVPEWLLPPSNQQFNTSRPAFVTCET